MSAFGSFPFPIANAAAAIAITYIHAWDIPKHLHVYTITQTFNAGSGEINMNIVKSASKLSNAFITLYRSPRGGSRYGYYMPDDYI